MIMYLKTAIIFSLPFILFCVCGSPALSDEKKRPPVIVDAEKIQTYPLTETLSTIGNLLAERTIVIRPEVDGRVKNILFLDGDQVQAGEVILTLDDQVAQAELDMATAKAKLSEAEYRRAQQLFDKKVSSGHDKEKAYAQWQVDLAAQALQQAKLDQLSIRAPFSGVIGLMKVSPGDYLKAGRDIVLLVALDPLIVDFSVTENMLAYVAVGQSFDIQVGPFPNQTFQGVVKAIEPQVDLQSRSVLVRGAVRNPHQQLRPGLFAQVNLVLAEKNQVIMVPEQSLLPEGKRFFVYVLESNVAKKRQVTIGVRQSGRVEIVSGVTSGEILVTAGQFKLREGAISQPRNLLEESSIDAAIAGQNKPESETLN